MTLTLEQFNLLASKEEFNQLEKKVDKLGDQNGRILDTLDVIVQKLDKHEIENVVNIEAHARINRDLLKIKDQAKIKEMEVVKQV